MPRLIVILAALAIVGAAGLGAYQGYAATEPEAALPVPSALVPVSLSKSTTEPSPSSGYDEMTVRQMARREVLALIGARAPSPAETVTSEPAVVEAAAAMEAPVIAATPAVEIATPDVPAAAAEAAPAEIG